MSQRETAPADWSWSYFKAVCADVSSWTWGTVQGAFNEKASLSQIIVDAFVGMIPLLGDATAARDLIAVTVGMIDDEEKRNSTWQWVLLVILLFALIPVMGGVIKGVGRILVKAAEGAIPLAPAARVEHMTAAARDIIAFLNRIGAGNAEKWLLSLRFAEHQAAINRKFLDVVDAFYTILDRVKKAVGKTFPEALTQRMTQMQEQLLKVKSKGSEMVPAAIKELDTWLREIQTFIRTGGETTSRVALHEVATGERVVTRTEEARLSEHGIPPVKAEKLGFPQNPADPETKAWQEFYERPAKNSVHHGLV